MDGLKWILAGMVILLAAVGILWLTIGGLATGIVFGAVALLVIIVATFVFASWWSARLMERGAHIALQSQISDDRRDVIQIKALTDLTQAALKIGQQQATQRQADYPALMPPNGQITDGEFKIAGLDDDEPIQ
jgi:hypothetical protein